MASIKEISKARRFMIVIEAPGKVESLDRIFNSLGIDATIVATGGHIFSNPDSLSPLGIDKGFRETMRRPVSEGTIDNIVSVARRNDFILIATDPDQEGDVIAADVFGLVSEFRPCARLKLFGLDKASVQEACGRLADVKISDAWPGTARRISDRLIGSSLSTLDSGVPVGRIQSALLGILAKRALPYGEIRLELPSVDGGKFLAIMPVSRDNIHEMSDLNAMADSDTLPAVEIKDSELIIGSAPWNMAESVINIHERLDVPISEAYNIMQSLYESGKMSYPRANAHALTEAGLSVLDKICDSEGVASWFNRKAIPSMAGTLHAHESPRPITPGINIGIPIKLMSTDDAALALITRNLVMSGMTCNRQIPVTSNLPGWAKSLPWERIQAPPVPWVDPDPGPGIHAYTLESSLMRAMNNNSLGRPSTQVQHAVKFASRGLATPDLALTEKGYQWMEATPKELLDSATSRAIEGILDERNTPPEQLVAQVIGLLGDDSASKIMAQVERQEEFSSRTGN